MQMSQSVQTSKSWSSWHERLHKKLQRNKDLMPYNSTLLLGVSGGQDSMALLKLLIDLKRIYKWNIHVWHGDHGWNKNSSTISKELKNWCLKEKISFFSSQTNKNKTFNEEAARNWRYKTLTNQAKTLSALNVTQPCEIVVTGHTATDRAETFIMNMARGSDIAGLSSLREKRILNDQINLVRPLLIFSRAETAQICQKMELPIWLDPSNENLNLTRNKIRQKILPILDELHKGSDLRIAALAERMSKYNDDQTNLSELLIETFERKRNNTLCRIDLSKLSPSSRRSILVTWLRSKGISISNSLQLEELSHKLSRGKPPGSIDLPGGNKITWTKETIELSVKNSGNKL